MWKFEKEYREENTKTISYGDYYADLDNYREYLENKIDKILINNENKYEKYFDTELQESFIKMLKKQTSELINVTYRDIIKSSSYSYYNEKRNIFGKIIRVAGIYKNKDFSYNLCKLPHEYILIGNEVYIKPTVTLYFESGCMKNYYFNTYEELLDFIKV